MAAPRPLRVLHVAPLAFRKDSGVIGGAERYVMELGRHMAERVTTDLLTFGPQSEAYSVGQLRVRVEKPSFYVRGQKANPFYVSLWNAIRKADVVHFHQKHILLSSYGALLCRLLRKKAFVTDLGGGGWDVSAYVDTDPWYRAELHLSAYAKTQCRGDGVKTDPVILGGIDTVKFSPAPRDASVAPYFLFVGRLLPHKGVDLILEALTPEMKLIVVGQPYDVRYVDDLKRLGVGKRVEFREDVDDTELVGLYRNARAILLTSLHRDRYGNDSRVPELLGQALLEGMACGAPGVATRVASLPEIIRDEVDGYLVAPEAAALRARLLTLWENADHATAMGKKARERVLEKFTWDGVVGRCLDAYRE